MLTIAPDGIYCPAGDFHVDPWRPVAHAVITHAHADHATPGSRTYLTARRGEHLLRNRLGPEASIETAGFGERIDINGVGVSLHPAGHILGSAQVRIEYRGEVWVVSGDYRLEPDATCDAWEPLACHTFVTESTFGLPIYRWRPQAEVTGEIDAWWRANREAGKVSVLFAYALGKTQRVLAAVDPSIGPVVVHPSAERINAIYRSSGVDLPFASSEPQPGALVLAPLAARGSEWLRRCGSASTALASGWMRIRGTRRRRSLDRGFALSDHADWPGLLRAVAATGAERIWVTHGYRSVLARWLQERGHDAQAVGTQFDSERDETGEDIEVTA